MEINLEEFFVDWKMDWMQIFMKTMQIFLAQLMLEVLSKVELIKLRQGNLMMKILV
jgi:hypothetical protein